MDQIKCEYNTINDSLGNMRYQSLCIPLSWFINTLITGKGLEGWVHIWQFFYICLMVRCKIHSVLESNSINFICFRINFYASIHYGFLLKNQYQVTELWKKQKLKWKSVLTETGVLISSFQMIKNQRLNLIVLILGLVNNLSTLAFSFMYFSFNHQVIN